MVLSNRPCLPSEDAREHESADICASTRLLKDLSFRMKDMVSAEQIPGCSVSAVEGQRHPDDSDTHHANMR
jgi:hypothetical protein